MDNVNAKQARLGSLNWNVLSGGTSTKPTDPPPAAVPAKPDSLEVKTPVKGASGSAVKDQVLRINGEIAQLNVALDRNEVDLTNAHFERAQLSDALAAKLKKAEVLAGQINGAEDQKAQLATEISQIKDQIAGLDGKISGLRTEQAGLLKREAELAKQHRTLYDQANADKNYSEYLKTVPTIAQGDNEQKQASDAAGSDAAKQAQDALKRTESQLRDTNADQAVNQVEQHFLSFRKLRLKANGEAKSGELNATQQKIDGLVDQQGKLAGAIHQNAADIDRTDARIAKAEDSIKRLEGKIAELKDLRDQILAEAIATKQQDAQEIKEQLAKLDELVKKLQGQLKQTQADLQDLKQLRDVQR